VTSTAAAASATANLYTRGPRQSRPARGRGHGPKNRRRRRRRRRYMFYGGRALANIIIIIIVIIEAVFAETQQPARSLVYRRSYHHTTRTIFGGSGRHAPVRGFVADG